VITERGYCSTLPVANYFQLPRTYTAAGKMQPRCRRRAAHNGEFIDASRLAVYRRDLAPQLAESRKEIRGEMKSAN